MDRVRNEEVHRRAGIERKLASIAEVSGGRVRGRPRLGWIDGVEVAFGKRRMTVEAARQ